MQCAVSRTLYLLEGKYSGLIFRQPSSWILRGIKQATEEASTTD